jgi:hypothetical protein
MIERCHEGGSRSVAARVVAIILSVADRPGRSMADVARCAGLPVSTTHRLLGELVASRLVERSPQGRYRIGASGRPGLGLADVPLTAPAIGGLTGADRATMVRSHVAAVLDYLASVTGLRARFGVWHERGVSILDRAAGRGPGVCVSGLDVVPVHATALDGATAGVGRGLRDRWRGNRGQPGPGNVIPRPVPRRRLAALRRSPRHLPWARLPPRRVVGGLSVVQEGLIGVSSRGQGR